MLDTIYPIVKESGHAFLLRLSNLSASRQRFLNKITKAHPLSVMSGLAGNLGENKGPRRAVPAAGLPDSTGVRGEPAYKPGSVEDSHSSRTRVTARLKRPTRGHARAARCGTRPLAPLFGLAPGGVYPAADVAIGAVRSYRTFSPLPPEVRTGPRRRDRRCIFCGTFRGLTPPRRYLAPCPLEPGLSSPPAGGRSGCPAGSRPPVYPKGKLDGAGPMGRSRVVAEPRRTRPPGRSAARAPVGTGHCAYPR
jgi:hypothetical protein